MNQDHTTRLDGDSAAAHFADAAMIPQSRLHRLFFILFSNKVNMPFRSNTTPNLVSLTRTSTDAKEKDLQGRL